MPLQDPIQHVNKFKGQSLAETITSVEEKLPGKNAGGVRVVNDRCGVEDGLLLDALAIKRASTQIDAVIHSAGILYALPFLLLEGEVITRVHLGAGNPAGDFHLVTTQRIAQFKFARWEDKGNGAREVSLFEDFFKLACDQGPKPRYLYLLDTVVPLRFLQSGRDIDKVLKQNPRMQGEFVQRYGRTYRTVGQYYAAHRQTVRIVNLRELIPGLEQLFGDPTVDE